VRSLFGVEDVERYTASSAVDACARDLDAPALGGRTKHGEIIVNSRKLMGTCRRRPAPALEGTLPVLSVVVLRVTQPGVRRWLHDPGDRVAP
jgi:hypothetical protein